MLRLALVLAVVLAPAASAQVQPTVIAGTGEAVTDEASRGDGGPATAARFGRIDGLDWAGDGSILVADGTDARIRHITPQGKIRTNRADGLDEPTSVFSTGWYPNEPFQPHQFIYADTGRDTVEDWFLTFTPFSATWNHTTAMEDTAVSDVERSSGGSIWAADPGAGTVWSVAFTPFPTNQWGQSAVLEGLDNPRGIGPLPGGGFLVTTRGDCRITRHTENGTKVLAGTGFCAGRERTGHGDGGPALEAHLRFPDDVEATPDGGFVFIERERVRRVEPDGTISTLYYTGFPGSIPPPDGGFPQPSALESTPDGDVLIGLDRRVLHFDTNYAPPATPTPTPTPTVNPTPPPPPGPGSPAPKPLTAALSKSAYKVKKGKKLAVVFNATSAGVYRLEIRKGKKLAKRFKGPAKAGRNAVKRKLAIKPGRYSLVLRVKAGGASVKDTARLRVTRPH